jgi:ADP-heptose:LPS heptosyltransferase
VSLTTKIKAYLLRFFTSKKARDFDIRNVKKVLFFRYDRIGDMVITTPVFRELKLFIPEIKITVLASKANQSVLSNNPYIDDIFINYKNSFLNDFQTLFRLRKKKFDVCVEFDHSVVPHAILRLKIINPKIVISVAKEGRYGVKGSELKLYDFYTEKKNNLHFRDIWLETLSPLNIRPKSNQYDLFCTSSQIQVAKNFISKFHGKFLIGINLEGAVEGKKIQNTELEQICKGIKQANNNIQIIILTAPNNLQSVSQLVEEIGLEYVVTSYKTKTILDVAALIKNLDIIITPDTSIVHIASAFDKPIVTIHENNQDSFQLFSPTSSLNKTVFSSKDNSINGFDVKKVIDFSNELIKGISE